MSLSLPIARSKFMNCLIGETALNAKTQSDSLGTFNLIKTQQISMIASPLNLMEGVIVEAAQRRQQYIR